MQIQIEKSLDVDEVEHQLAELWKGSGGDGDVDHEAVVLRARVANLLVFVTNDELLDEVRQLLPELTAIHPSRVLMMHGDRSAPDLDIEMAVTSFFQTDKRGGKKRLCCEEITLKAQGEFVVELPSAALPLLVSDLATFLWWRGAVQVSDNVFEKLIRAIDRLVIDSAEFEDPATDLRAAHKLYDQANRENVGISDLNWARLTYWRALLADFYDVPTYQPFLDKIDYVRIDYVGPARKPTNVAPQALLIAGWLASRLRWELLPEQASDETHEKLSVRFSCENRSPGPPNDAGNAPTISQGARDREIKLELNRVDGGEHQPGRLVRVELRTNVDQPAFFTVARSADNLHLTTEAKFGLKVNRGRVLPVRNRSAAQLLSREMEILCNDRIYEEALAVATKLI